jgi:hypothetical protein
MAALSKADKQRCAKGRIAEQQCGEEEDPDLSDLSVV